MFLTSFRVWLNDLVLCNRTHHADLKFVAPKLAIPKFFGMEMVNILQAQE